MPRVTKNPVKPAIEKTALRFVGRVNQVAQFRDSVRYMLGTQQKPADRHFAHIFIACGEGGMGKSTLLRRWCDVAQQEGIPSERVMAAHPDAALEGTAQITISGKTGNVKLTKRELQVLGAQRSAFADADDVWETTLDVALASAWSRVQAKGGTAGWRLRRDPEPLTVGKQLLVPDFVLMRGSHRLPLFVPVTAASAESVLGTLTSTEHAVILLNTELGMTKRAASNVVSYQTMPDVSALVRYLQANFAENAVTTALDRWTQLTNVLDSEGFVSEAQLFTLLGCDNATTAVAMLRGWRDGAFHYVPHVGLCTPQKLRNRRVDEEGGVVCRL